MQIIFNGKYSFDDFGIIVESFSIQPPSKKKIKENVPYMNGTYDFSTVGSSGEITYNERTIKVRFNFIEQNRSLLYMKYSNFMEWLLDTGRNQLVFADMPDYYFMAEVESAPSFEELVAGLGFFEVEFIAEPFKYGANYEGIDIWDTFNFEEDIVQNTEFDGPGIFNIYNPGRVVKPLINCSTGMRIKIGDYSCMLNKGDNTDWGFKLQPGMNTIELLTIGHIKFIFRKQKL